MKFAEKIRERACSPGRGARPLMIAFLGDSVTQGCFEIYATKEGSVETKFRSWQAYHHKLERMLGELFPAVAVNVINAGISGDNALSGRDRVLRDVIDFHPDLAVVCYGLNDVNLGLEGLSVYEEALEGIFGKLKEAGTETIFMTPNMIGTKIAEEMEIVSIRSVAEQITAHQVKGEMDVYMEKAREVCAANGVPVCDCYRKWKRLEESGADVTRLLANRVNHPTENLHWLFAASLFEMMLFDF